MIFFQFPNAHFPEESRPAAITVPSVRETNSMAVSGCYGNNICPISYVTLAIRTVSCCQCSSVRAHCHSMIFSSRHSNNIRPIRYVTLTKLIISCGPGGFHLPSELRYGGVQRRYHHGLSAERSTVQEGASLHINRKTWLVPATLLHSWDRFFPLLRHTYRRTAPPCVVLPAGLDLAMALFLLTHIV